MSSATILENQRQLRGCCDYSDDLENLEYVYKYYIHHGVSMYLSAFRDLEAALCARHCPSTRTPAPSWGGDPIDCCCDREARVWTVQLDNLYSPGQPQGCRTATQCPKCHNKSQDCVWACTSGLHTTAPVGSDYPNNRRERNIGVRMTTDELRKLMRTLECGRLHTGQIILE